MQDGKGNCYICSIDSIFSVLNIRSIICLTGILGDGAYWLELRNKHYFRWGAYNLSLDHGSRDWHVDIYGFRTATEEATKKICWQN